VSQRDDRENDAGKQNKRLLVHVTRPPRNSSAIANSEYKNHLL
jgi:hypothetical protein